MTVLDLIEALQDLPEDAVVVFGSDYGDICHTEQALVVRRVEELDAETERLDASDLQRYPAIQLEIRTVRPATTDEIEFCRWNEETLARETQVWRA
jgi:hypothetical protein